MSMNNIANRDFKASAGSGRGKAVLAVSLWISLLLMPLFGHAGSIQDQEAMRTAAESFLRTQTDNLAGNDIDIEIGQLDSRLRLTRCDAPLDAFLPAGARLQGKLTVGMRCASPKPWTVYLPARIRIYKEVVAAAHPLSRGTTVAAGDVVLIRQEVSNQHVAYFEDVSEVVGKVLTRGINSGQIFTANKLKAPLMIRRGEEVTILAEIGSLEVRSRGKALKDAAHGDVLTVRNNRSKRVIQVIAVKPGTVKVNM